MFVNLRFVKNAAKILISRPDGRSIAKPIFTFKKTIETMVTVWQFDDLWEEGYRFDDVVTKRYCWVERKYVKNEVEALEFLIAAYKFIPKIQGTSKPLKYAQEMSGSLIAVIVDDQHK